MVTLAERVKNQESIAKSIDEYMQLCLYDYPKLGRPKPPLKYKPVSTIVAQSESGLDTLMETMCITIGARKRGNKRWGSQALYTDLTQYFILLHKRGCVLPRNYLSLDACSDHLAEILARHRYLPECELHSNPLNDAEIREYIANSLARVFIKIADSIEKPPPAIKG